MKRIFYFLGLAILFSGIYTSCKQDPLDELRENEIVALNKYVNDNTLTDKKDVSGIYFKDLIKGTGDSIKRGYKVMMYFDITFLDGTPIPQQGFSTDDGYGRNYEEYPFYVDVTDATINERYVQQIAGMHYGLKKMLVGGKAFFVIPSELAFKAVDNSSTLGIPRFSTLLATVTVRKALSPAQQKEEQL